MPNAFNFSASPFDCLSTDEQALVRSNVDIAYFQPQAVVLEVGAETTHLFVIIKGYVTQMEGDEVQATFGPDDCFDGRSLVAGRASSRFVAAEEVLVYQLARATVQELIARNATFGALLFSDLGNKLSALAQRAEEHETQSLLMARVDQAYLRPAHTVPASASIVQVAQVFKDQRTTSVLVEDPSRGAQGLGIFTATSLQHAVLDGRALDRLPVGDLAVYPVVTVQASDTIGDAMAVLLRARVHRVEVVDEAGQVQGLLRALDLFSFVANQSHLVGVQIEQASTLEDLQHAAALITQLIAALHRGGMRIGLMTRLVQQLNTRLFERAWGMIAPSDLQANSCLFVMGSEGRGEQLLKTDQDNGLLLRDGYQPPHNLAEICQQFSDALARFGYPECPGRIMLNNPAWRGTVKEFTQRVKRWLLVPEGADDLMHLGIFLDALAVAGDAHLLTQVRDNLQAFTLDSDVQVARFAAAVDAFGSPASWWGRLLGRDGAEQVNLKKAGLFPIVHGVRSLALAQGIGATSTAERLDALVAQQVLDPKLGQELQESLYFLMGLRLQAGLHEWALHRPISGNVDPSTLSSLERDLLKDTLAVVKRFKAVLHQRLRLDLV